MAYNFKTATINHSVTPPGFKFYFKTTPSGNLANFLLASLQDFDPTWIIYERAEQGVMDAQRGHAMKVLLYNLSLPGFKSKLKN